MKLNKKKIVVVSIAVCLVAILSMGTLAWFTDSDSTTNEFFVTDSTQGPDAVFSIEVKEIVDGQAQPVDNARFEDILPGQVIGKEPYVYNTGAYDQYVRATVTISDYAAFAAALGNYPLEAKVFGGINPAWVFDSKVEDTTADTVSYVFYYNGVLAPYDATTDNKVVLFETVTIPTELTQQDMASNATETTQNTNTLADGFTISVLAEAVQTENVGVTNETGAAAAKVAFDFVAAN